MSEEIATAAALAAKELPTLVERLYGSSTSSSTTICHVQRAQKTVRRLSSMLVWILAGLNDAEEDTKGRCDPQWLRELKGMADAAEDLLDEFLYEVQHLRLMGETVIQVSDSIPSTQPHELVAFLDDVQHRSEAISMDFDEITKYKAVLGSKESFGHRDLETNFRETSGSIRSSIFGRENDLKNIKEFLLDEAPSGTSNTSAIVVVGLGGLGKTTLAQLVYNDDAVTEYFDLKLWIWVSENFDVVRLTKAMIESITQKECRLSTLDSLQAAVMKELKGKSFLLVLDDVWEETCHLDYWESFIVPLDKESRGGKIIVTTRNVNVSKIVMATSTYHLPCLQYEDCLKLFSQLAFKGRDPNLSPNLMAIGKKISMKCNGLPLVARSLGSLLYNEDNEQMWINILESDFWNISDKNEIIPVLRLSYQHLPAQLKRCFRYCSVFPKGYQFNKERLVQMWMAHGYMKTKERKLMEDIGKEYFDYLLSRSFFQYSQELEKFFMHDLIHDLARFVSEEECSSVENGMPFNIPEHVRHFSFVPRSSLGSVTLSVLDISMSGTLRSFLFINTKWLWHPMKLHNNLFTEMKHVRVLDLSDAGLKDLPNSIGCLKHIRYLSLRANPLEQLPQSVGRLYHLQTLDIASSCIKQLPASISNLLNMRHLIHDREVVYPAGIKRLTNLQTMANFHVSFEPGHAKLVELKCLSKIRSLVISGINNLGSVNEAKESCLAMMEQLWNLHLSWDAHSTSFISDEVLENLIPNFKLKQLEISFFNGHSLPLWLGNPYFTGLASVVLQNCSNLSSLSHLGQLPSLKFLSILSAEQVKYIGREFFSGGFPLLEILQLRRMKNWRSSCGIQKGDCPRLRELIIVDCDHLQSLSVTNLDALQVLDIRSCRALRFSEDSLQLGALPSLRHIFIKSIWNAEQIRRGMSYSGNLRLLDTSSLILKDVGQLGAWSHAIQGACAGIRKLAIYGGEDVTSFPFTKLNALEYLTIADCHQFQFSYEDQLSSTLRYITIDNCGGLMCLPFTKLNALEDLTIRRCPRLQFSYEDQLSPTLQSITIYNCGGLMFLPLSNNLKALKDLIIEECPRLNFSNAAWLPLELRLLQVRGCPLLTQWCQLHRRRLVHIPKLRIQGIDGCVVLRNVLGAHEASEALLAELQTLHTLELAWNCNTRLSSFTNVKPEQVLEHLRPHSNLSKLVILGYIGSQFATWLGDPSFSNLVYITLLGCSECELLPPLGQLPHLMELFIERAEKLRHMGKEFFNGNSSSGRQGFPCLRKLELNHMPNLELAETEDGHLPSLCELILKHCPVLKTLPHLPPSLVILEVANCNAITFPHSFDHLTSLRTMKISQVPILHKLPDLPLGLRKLVLQGLPVLVDLVTPATLRDLVLEGCSEAMVAASLPHLTHLTCLCISDFPNLKILPLHNLVILQELHILSCPKLMSFGCFSFSVALGEYIEGLQALKSLEHLSISDCPALHFSANERPPSALQSMDITNCPSLAAWHDKHWRSHKQTDQQVKKRQ